MATMVEVQVLLRPPTARDLLKTPAFDQLADIVRGGVEAIAYADRKIQQEEEQRAQEERATILRAEAQSAIRKFVAIQTLQRQ